jgi:hypothetical protein
MAINFAPLYDRRTIEFRLHNATLNPIKAFAFAMLCRNFVDKLTQMKKFVSIKPDVLKATLPKRIRTARGGDFYLQRDETGKWLIESKKLKLETDLLATAFDNHRKQLRLRGKRYLPAFHYPHYGNAFSELCELLEVNGMFRGFMEDHYDHITRKFGTVGKTLLNSGPLVDEADFYNEVDYDPNLVRNDENDSQDDADDEDNTSSNNHAHW